MLQPLLAEVDMRQILYVSAAKRLFTPSEMDSLLHVARVNNATLDVTGVLLTVDGSFLQVLEGDPVRLEPLMAKIRADTRHTRVTRLIDRSIETRQFPNWSMGFAGGVTEARAPWAFRITRENLSRTLTTPPTDEIFALIGSFCEINGRALGTAWAS